MNTKPKVLLLLAAGLIVLCGLAGYVGASLKTSPQAAFSLSSQASFDAFASPVANTPPTAPPADFTRAAAVATSSVVFIKTQAVQARSSFNDWFFGDPFGQQQGSVLSSGSGVVISDDGYIVTNNHVIENATNIEVVANRKSYSAKLVGADPSSDLALLQIEGSRLHPLKFANSNKLRVGEWVAAIGNPFNLNSTVTAGIVSAKGRNLNLVNALFPVESFIQTDAAINPGNSGGALVNLNGELVGINTAILSKTGSYNGYGFAVPSNIVAKIISDLKQYGTVQRAFIGATVSEADNSLSDDERDINGVYVQRLDVDGAAAKAGLAIGDEITGLDGIAVNSRAAFEEAIAYHHPGDKVLVAYKHEGKARTASLILTNREGEVGVVRNTLANSETLGADFETVPKVERERLNLNTPGWRVVHLRNGKLARIGLPENFVITSINRKQPANAQELISLLESARGNLVIEGVNENGTRGYVQVYLY